MKNTLLTLAAFAVSLSAASGASVSLSTTSVGSRVIDAVRSPQDGLVAKFSLGTMTSEADFKTFSAFGTGATGVSSGFPTGGVPNGTATNNTASAADFAGKSVYIVFYAGNDIASATFAGIYKSTDSFSGTISSSASQTFNLTVANFTTAINPTNPEWTFLPASVNTAGTTGTAGGTARTGIVFDLGAAAAVVPEPASVTFLGLSVLGFLAQRRRK